MSNLLVTGGCGFIGSNFVRHAVRQNDQVTIVDDLSNGHKEFLTEILKDVEFLNDDFASPRVLSVINDRRFDAVIHFAAIPRVSYSVEHPIVTNDNNVTKTLKLIDACRLSGNTEKFVFASSSSVYGGASELPTKECSSKNPKSPYALQKSIIEDYLQLYDRLYAFDSVCLRFFNVFGPNCLGTSPYSTAVSAWLTAIKQNRPMRFDGDGTQTRDMCYVDNVVDAVYRAATHDGALGSERYNVACGQSISNMEIARILMQRYPDACLKFAPWRAGDVMHTLADISKIKSALRYTPIVTVKEGIKRTCDWFDANWDMIKSLSQNV